MSLFGVIMMFVTIGWTLFMMLVLAVLGDIYIFLRGPAVLFFTVGYVIIIIFYIFVKRLL